MLEPGLNLIIPFIDRVAYRHSLKEVPLDVPEQVCITQGQHPARRWTASSTYQVTDPRLASLRHVGLHQRHHAARADHAALRGRQDGARPDASRAATRSTSRSSSVLDEAGRTWGVKVLRYEIKNLTPPEAILRAMQAQITAEREKRALIAKSEGEKQQEINLADGEKQSDILQSEGEKQAAINKAQGEATAISADRRSHRGRQSDGGASRSTSKAACRRQPQGRRALHRRLRQSREDQQHAHRAEQRVRRRGPGGFRDDRARQDQADRTARGSASAGASVLWYPAGASA